MISMKAKLRRADTTDQLRGVLEHVSRGESYLAWRLLEEMETAHISLAEDLLSSPLCESTKTYIRQAVHGLHLRIVEVCQGEQILTSELRDWVMNIGAEISSRIVAAVLEENGIAAVHVRATQFPSDQDSSLRHLRHRVT